MIRTENLTKEYGDDRGVFDINLKVPEGKIYGYIGPNGSGKTTTIKLLCGLVMPTRGRAFIDNLEVLPKNNTEIKKKVGYLPDIFGVYEQMSVWEYLDFFCAAYRIPPKLRQEAIQHSLKLADAVYMLDYQVTSLSRGMRQRVGLAKTLLHDPKVLILDEPAGGLDPNARIEMRKTIQRLRDVGKTILLSSHILPELASVCDLVAILKKGVLLAQGTVREIVENLKQQMVLVIGVDSDVAKAVRHCLNFPNVEEAVASGNEVRVVFAGTRMEIADLNTMLVEKGVRVNRLHEEEVDLEKVFLSVTAEAKQQTESVDKAHTQADPATQKSPKPATAVPPQLNAQKKAPPVRTTPARKGKK